MDGLEFAEEILYGTLIPRCEPDGSREEHQQRTRQLLSRAGATADPGERRRLLDAVVALNMGVARNLAAGFAGRGIARDDLEQVAYLALTRLVRRYDPTTESDFLAYAVPTIRGELKKYFRDHGWTVRPPRRIQEIQTRVISERAELAQRLGREPTVSELAEATGEELASVREALSADGCFQPTSLDRLVGGERSIPLGELLDGGTDNAAQQAVEARVALAPVIRGLSERDRRILHMRYFEERTQEEIANDIGVSQMQVSRLLTRIIRDLRRAVGGGPTDRTAA